MNLLESGLVIERSLSKDVDHNRLINIRMNKTNSLKKKNVPRSSMRKVCSYIFLLDLYKYSSSWLHNNFFFFWFLLMILFCNGVLPFYILFPSFISAFHV